MNLINSGFFSGLVMNKIIIPDRKNDHVYMLIREATEKGKSKPNYVPAICYLNKNVKRAKYILERVQPGCVVAVNYVLKTLNIKVLTPKEQNPFTIKRQAFMVVKNIEILYVFQSHTTFVPVEQFVDIINDELFRGIEEEELEEIENLIQSKLEKYEIGGKRYE